MQQPFLVTMKPSAESASARVLVDPNTLDPEGRTSIAWYVPSRDGKKVAVTLARSGTEDGTVHVYDVASGKATGDVVPYANSGTALGSLAWNGDGTGFYYTRHPHPGEVPPEDMGAYQKIYFHKLGTKVADDKLEHGKDFPRIAEVHLEASEDGKFIHAAVQNGDGREFWHYVLGPSGRWVEFATLTDKITRATFGSDNKLYLLSLKESPRGKILRIDPAKPELAKAELVLPEGDAVIQQFVAMKSRLYATYVVGGPHEARVFDLKGKSLGTIPTLPVSSVYGVVRLEGDDVLFDNVSFTEPPAWYRYVAKGGKVEKTSLAATRTGLFEGVEVARETCTSKDGTKVPISILRKKGTKLDGQSPALLTGYGGYGVSLSPWYDDINSVLLENGFVHAIANLRGGGELGDAWHRAGNLTKKQNVFDDFAGCAKHLIETGYTKPERRAAHGRGVDAAARAVQGGGVVRGHLRHAPRRAHAERGVQRVGVWLGEGPRAVQGALRVLAVPPRERRHGLPRGAAPDGRERSARGPLPFAQNGGAPPGGHVGLGPHPVPLEQQRRPRGRHAALGEDRGDRRCLRVLVRSARR
jgi:prolyl oligopeptidase